MSESAALIRTDFSDEAAWGQLLATIRATVEPFVFEMEIVSDPTNGGATMEQLMGSIPEDYPHCFFMVADDIAIRQPDQPVLVVDLLDEPGRYFRTAASQIAVVENNLSLANMEFAEFAAMVDEIGVFRGIPGMEAE